MRLGSHACATVRLLGESMRTLLYSVIPAALLAASAMSAAAQPAPSGDKMVEQLLREEAPAEQAAPASAQTPAADCSTEELREKNQACWQAVQGESRGFSLASPAAQPAQSWQKVQGKERGFSLSNTQTKGRATAGSTSSRATAASTSTTRASVPSQRPTQVASIRRKPVTSYAAAAANCSADEVSGAGLNLCATFGLGSATLTDRTRKTLDELAGKLASDPRLSGRRFVISGHADASGDAARNQALSQARAQAVVDYLASRGVPADRLSAEGRGVEQPITGRSPSDPMNRRVQIRAAAS